METTLEAGARGREQPTGGANASELAASIAAWAAAERLATPAFAFVPQVLAPSVERLRQGLGARISYATKAGAHPLVLRELAGLVDEFNVTNLAHLDQLLELGVEPGRIAWVHPVLMPALLADVRSRGVTRFVVDDRRGLDLLRAARADAAITLRLRPPDAGESARSVVRFGNSAAVLRALAGEAVAAGLAVEAVSFFVGTHGEGMAEALPFRRGIEALAALHADLRADGVAVPTVNIGGGFPGSRRRFYRDHPRFLELVAAALRDAFAEDVAVLCEPGRYLAEPALALLTRVVADRELDGRRLVSVDASAYCGLFESSFVDPDSPLTIWTAPSRAGTAAPTPAELIGPVMDSFDVVRKGRALPPLADGELLVLPNVGAYAVGYTTACEGMRPPQVTALPDALGSALSEEWFA